MLKEKVLNGKKVLRKKALLLITAIAIALPLAAVAAPVAAYAAEEYTVTQAPALLYATDSADVYEQPDADTVAVTSIAQGTLVSVTGITSNGWFVVDLGGIYYVPCDGLSVTGESVAQTQEKAAELNLSVSTLTKINTILATIVNDSMSEFEKVKAVHDWMCQNIAYDYDSYRALKNGTGSIPSTSVSVEGVLDGGLAVCDGYSRTFKAFMDVLGIECERVTGIARQDSHAWNQVKVDGQWYNMDVTWDVDSLTVYDWDGDVVAGKRSVSYVGYQWFLVSDEALNGNHFKSTQKHSCPSNYSFVPSSSTLGELADKHCYVQYTDGIWHVQGKGKMSITINGEVVYDSETSPIAP